MTGWTPQDQPGGVYCSPRCGCRCKRVDYEFAVREAAALAERMGEGWKPHVWENGGWHFYAVKGESRFHSGIAEIHPNRTGRSQPVETYSAWINANTDGVTQVISDHVVDPVEALGLALQEARTRVLRYSAELDSITEGS